MSTLFHESDVGAIDGGRGLFASRRIHQGTVVLRERPQHVLHANKHETMVCSDACGCLKHLRQNHPACVAALALGAVTRQELLAGEGISKMRAALASTASSVFSFGMPSSSEEAAAVECDTGCGQLFCSKDCMREAVGAGHTFLCTGRCQSSDDALCRFIVHAMQFNDNYLLVAKVVARAVRRIIAEGSNIDDEWKPYGRLLPITAASGQHSQEDQAAHALLLEALMSQPEIASSNVDIEELLPFYRFSALLQKFVCNNVGIRVRHPVAEKLSLNTDNSCLTLANQLADILGSELNTDDEDPLSAADLLDSPDFYWPPVDGEGLYLQALIANHSCAPNIQLSFADGDATLCISALRDIEDKEELFHDYARHASSSKDRRSALLQYGIKCGCELCSAPDDTDSSDVDDSDSEDCGC
mmetsp:Transcript_22050/g.47960  ORF Transcript_22050/g.47960 Transcript_22050/m.47960 type:complete len:415 (-) Transcript_22050:280-1524(-)|eukprot:CAMPEP_0172315372 /NCGR_PEP_ID=MMETSP1058-20130122/24992_1 /TAXON_ID=83371 /ORGANISM="Detonula confervacea, Strain CCMP 353" /LENGTH=414 /DNA_ID=CAMNT_0013029443 /DNA_START=138 /DNA_END=1382 /DNA_ORIENTATION=+